MTNMQDIQLERDAHTHMPGSIWVFGRHTVERLRHLLVGSPSPGLRLLQQAPLFRWARGVDLGWRIRMTMSSNWTIETGSTEVAGKIRRHPDYRCICVF